MKSRASITQALISSAALKVASQILSWGVTLYCLRTLTPADYGIAAVATAILGLFIPFVDNPLVVSLTRARRLNARFLGQFRTYSTLLGLFLTVAIAGAGLIYGWFANNQFAFHACLVCSLHGLIVAQRTIPEAQLLRDGQIPNRALGLFLEALASSLTMLALVRSGFGFYALLFGPIIGMTVRTIFYNALVRQASFRPISWLRAKRLFRWNFFGVINEFLLFLGVNGPVLAASLVLTATPLGLFTTATNLLFTLVGKTMQVLNPIALSLVSKGNANAQAAGDTLTLGMGYLTLVGVPVFLGIAATSGEIIPLILGEKWRAASFAFYCIALVMPIRLLFEMAATGLRARGFDRALVRLQNRGVFILCVAVILGSQWGLHGVIIGFALAYGIYHLIALFQALNLLGLNIVRLLKFCMPAGLGGLGILLAASTVSSALTSSSQLIFFAKVLAGIAIYLPFGFMGLRFLRAAKTSLIENSAASEVQRFSIAPLGIIKSKTTASIFTFHRVYHEHDPFDPDTPTASEFDKTLKAIAKRMKILSLEDCLCAVRHNERGNFAAITFDDGYKDNLEVALPVLVERQIPATLFFSSGHIETGQFFVNTVFNTIKKRTPGTVDCTPFGMGTQRVATAKDASILIGRILEKIKYYHPDERDKLASTFQNLHGVSEDRTAMLSAEELKQLSSSGFEIASHTHHHTILTSASTEFIKQDVEKNRRLIEAAVGKAPRYFAYPNGKPGKDFARNEVELIEHLGFEAAFMSNQGILTPGTSAYLLPRISIGSKQPELSVAKHMLFVYQAFMRGA